MKIKLLLTMGFIALFSFANAQVKEMIDTKNGETIVTSSDTEMYGGTKSKEAEALYLKAYKYAKNGDLKQAEKYYLKSIKEDKEFVEAYDNLGRVYRAMKDYDKAIRYYKKSVKLYPDGVMAHQNLAIVYRIQGKSSKAIEEYKEIVRISPDNPEGPFGLANVYMGQKKYDKALVNAKMALQYYKESESSFVGDGYYLVGIIHYYDGNKKEAKEYLQAAKSLGVNILPKIDKEVFGEEAASSAEAISIYDWLMNTPLEDEPEKRKELSILLVAWMTSTPDVTIEISADLAIYEGCDDCFIIFLGGWAKNAIVTEDKSSLSGNLAGIKSVIKFYKKNKALIGRNKGIEKMMKLEKKGKLRKYVKGVMLTDKK